jgi:hypothetical protein
MHPAKSGTEKSDTGIAPEKEPNNFKAVKEQT